MDYLNLLDHKLFEWIQLNLHYPIADWWITIWRDKYFWIPLYIFLISLLAFEFRAKFFLVFLFVIITISISDQSSSQFIKKWIKRPRPCQEEYFKDHFNSTIKCSGGYSMPSSHATNHMAVAMFLFFLLQNIIPRWRYLLMFWAVSIGFAQIYVGVHFPADVLVGLCLGAVIGSGVYFLYSRFTHFLMNRKTS